MKRLLARIALVAMLLMLAASANAQNPNYDSGPVWRVIYLHIKPGQGDAFWNDIKQNLKPVWDAEKQQGIISDYKFYTNPIATRQDDWTVALGILYPNWAALDELDAKGATISAQHYGSRDAMQAAGQKRLQMVDIVSIQIAREVRLK